MVLSKSCAEDGAGSVENYFSNKSLDKIQLKESCEKTNRLLVDLKRQVIKNHLPF
jgi:hypothetical protein